MVVVFKYWFTNHIKVTTDVKSINIKNQRYYFFNDMINKTFIQTYQK